MSEQAATDTADTIVPYDKWNARLSELQQEYAEADPYPHIMLNDFLQPTAAEKIHEAFPAIDDKGWIHYVHYNEKKHGLNKFDMLPAPVQELIRELNSDRFVAFLSRLTGIEGLIADPGMEGGGLHQSPKGGFLNIHADFTVHPHHRKWRRRVNVLVYMNKDWEDAYGGHLELWDRAMKKCVQKISPLFNRCVIFNTDKDSFHGHPEPLQCPPDTTRKSIALYYFTEEDSPHKSATNYKPRPGEGIKGLFIYLDKKLVSLYTAIKGWLGLDDDFVSRVLNWFSGSKKK